MGMAWRAQQCAWELCDSWCQHPRFYCASYISYSVASTHVGQLKPEICKEREGVRNISLMVTTLTDDYFYSQYIQLIIIPIAFTFASFVGIAVTSAGITLYGQVLWDPLKLVDQWDNRAAAFFVSFAFVLSTLGTNVSANSLSAGNDMTALCPRYINIRRGQMICAFLGGWALCPWEILARCVAKVVSLLRGGCLTYSCIVQRASWLSWAGTPSSLVRSPES
jgi:Permease for cytosine/purines, uracil, thiamine, allantoin